MKDIEDIAKEKYPYVEINHLGPGDSMRYNQGQDIARAAFISGSQYGKEWVSVKDEMPDYDEYVLWLFEDGNCHWDALDKDGNPWLYGGKIEEMGMEFPPATYFMRINIPDQPIK